MTFLIAAAGTGGHVFPGLAVGEALLDLGVPRDQVVYVGGDRLESTVYPAEGFPFVQVEVRGMSRSLSRSNLSLPVVVSRARSAIATAIRDLDVGAVLGMGGYVTIPAGLAARSTRTPFFNSEQNAAAGLASKTAARWARRTFVSFPNTSGLPRGEWVGNPVRRPFWDFRRSGLTGRAQDRYGLEPDVPVLGVFGGSLGSAPINSSIAGVAAAWEGKPIQILHLTGDRFLATMEAATEADGVGWRRFGFAEEMDLFYAACDLVVARAGGAVAEITATSTPAILVPGRFGSAGHQTENARFLAEAGAAKLLDEDRLTELSAVVEGLLFDEDALQAMRVASGRIARPRAAHSIAAALIEAHK